MLSITRFTLWKEKISIVVWALSISFLNLIFAPVYKDFSKDGQSLELIYSAFENFESFIEISDIATPEGFINTELFSIFIQF
jgi:putative exporter of polyketide antibiotics